LKNEALDVLNKLFDLAGPTRGPAHDPHQQPMTSGGDGGSVAGDIKEIKETLKAMIADKPKTWAQVARTTPNTGEVPGWRQRQEKLRRERAKTNVLITTRNANEEAKQGLKNMDEAQITATAKGEMVRANKDPNSIQAVRKTANHGLCIQCPTEQAAEEVRTMDWRSLLGGSEVIKPQYGVVVHGVLKLHVNFDTQSPDEINKRIGDLNDKINIKRVVPLRKRTRNPNASAQSIIIFVEDPAKADECISHGIYIGKQNHAAERYMPQCQIKQCFNCQGYGHTAGICTGKKACGNCGKDHETRECKNEEAHCVQCQGPHPAWHHECPVRKRESMRLESMRDELSSWFTK